MKKILIDTDVLLDVLFDRLPFSVHSAQVLSLCETGKIKGFITPVTGSNLYYLLRQKAEHKKVIKKMNLLLFFIEVFPVDNQIFIQALNSEFKDFEDALQNYAAEASKSVEFIVTRNIKDYSRSKLVVLTPEIFIKMLKDI